MNHKKGEDWEDELSLNNNRFGVARRAEVNEGLKIACEHPSARVSAMAKQLPKKLNGNKG